MKAVVCGDYGPIETLAIRDVPEPSLTRDGVRIRMKVAALNPPDILMAQGKYQVKPPVPFVLGVEGMGTVLEAGPRAAGFKPGDRVMTYAGQGCFAEQVVAASHLVHHVPEGMPDEVAAGFSLAYGTSYHALVDRGRLQPGETVVVLGAAGGLGLCTIQIAKALGATVIAAASTPAKLETCRENGADHLINTSTEPLRDSIRALTGDRGADVIYDPVGGALTEDALRGIGRYGRLLIIGYASGTIPLIKANLILLKQADVIGVSFRQFAQQQGAEAARGMAALCRLWQEGKLKPLVSAWHPLEEIVTAMKLLTERRIMGKAVVTI